MAIRSLRMNWVQLISAVTLFTTMVACSPSAFFGSGKDQEVSAALGYRRINLACAGMQLSSALMDVPTFRKLLSCLNSEGALEPVQQLIDHLSDSDVQSLVDTSNHYMLGDTQLLYAFNRSFYTLVEKKTLDTTFMQFGRILENEDFVSAGLAILKDKYFSDHDGNLLKAIEQISKKLDHEGIADGLDLALSAANSKAFGSLQSHFRGDSPTGQSLREMTEKAVTYLHETADPKHVNAGKEVIRAILLNHLLETIDTVTGTSAEEMRTRIPRLSSVLKVELANHGRLMGGINSLFHYLHKQPISCMGGTKEVHDGVMHFVREMSRLESKDVANFIRRNNVLMLTAMNPLCEYPAELNRYYPALMELASSPAIEPAADLFKALYQVGATSSEGVESRPLVELLTSILSDTGSGVSNGPAEDTSGIKNLIPILAEVNDRGAWDDVLLLGTQIRPEERQRLKDILIFLMAPVQAMGNQSVYDVLSEAFSSTSASSLYDLILSLRRFVEAKDSILLPAMTGLRSAYYANDVHPVLDLVHKIMAEATQNKRLFDTLFKISGMREFKDTIRLFSVMSKDGRLKDLLGVLVTLFEKFAMEGKFEIHATTEPVFVPKLRHNLSTADLVPFDSTVHLPASDPCAQINLNQNLSDTGSPQFSQQVSNVVACLNSQGQYADVQATIQFLKAQKAEDGRDFLTLGFDLVKSLGLSFSEQGLLTDQVLSAVDDGRLFRLMDALPLLVTHPYPALADSQSDFGPVLEPLLEVLRPVMGANARPSVERLEAYGASLLRRQEIPAMIKYADDLLGVETHPTIAQDPQGYDLKTLERIVKNKECRADSSDRAAEIIQDYQNAVTNWDLVDGKARKGWTISELRQSVSPMLEKLALPHGLNPGQHVYDSLLQIMRYFTLEPGKIPNRYQHYPSKDLVKWLHERSVDFRPVTYYYAGESVPRVRLMNTLDRLELVVVEADFTAPLLDTNFSLKFLADIAEAWGDEPYDIWPDEIKDKFPNGRGVKTLRQVVADINSTQGSYEGIVGFPSLPGCYQADPSTPADPSGGGSMGWVPAIKALKPHLFNLHQVLPVLEENVNNGGLRVLRDLFFEVYYSSSPEFMGPTYDGNNLNVILKLVRMGIFRQIGRNIRLMDMQDPSLNGFFKAIIPGAISPDLSALLNTWLNQDPGQKTLWKLIEEIFTALGPKGNASEDALYFKQMVFHLVAATGQLDLTSALIKDLSAIVSKYNADLAAHSDQLQVLFKSKKISSLVRAFDEDQNAVAKGQLSAILKEALGDPIHGLDLMAILKAVNDDTAAKAAWNRMSGRLDALLVSPEYQALDIKPILESIIRLFEERNEDPALNGMAHRLRLYLAERLESKDFDQFLLLARDHPTEFYRIFSTLSHETENGDLKELLRIARRSLSSPQH